MVVFLMVKRYGHYVLLKCISIVGKEILFVHGRIFGMSGTHLLNGLFGQDQLAMILVFFEQQW
jgi:hypothetical protein